MTTKPRTYEACAHECCQDCGYPFDKGDTVYASDEWGPRYCSVKCWGYRPTWRCATCGKESDSRGDFDERYSFGVYAGRYCSDACWRDSGYRDAVDPDAEFSELDAGERIEEDY